MAAACENGEPKPVAVSSSSSSSSSSSEDGGDDGNAQNVGSTAMGYAAAAAAAYGQQYGQAAAVAAYAMGGYGFHSQAAAAAAYGAYSGCGSSGAAWAAAAAAYGFGSQSTYAAGALNVAGGSFAGISGCGSAVSSSGGARLRGGAGGTGSAGLLEELKAKHAAREATREELQDVRKQLEACDTRNHRRQRVFLQMRADEVEHRLRLMGDVGEGPKASSASWDKKKSLKPPEDGRMDQFARLCHILVQYLRSCDPGPCPLSQVLSERRIHQEWSELVRSRLVEEGTEIKDLLAARDTTFECVDDDQGQPCVRLVYDLDVAGPGKPGDDGRGSGSSSGRAGGGGCATAVNAGAGDTHPMRPEQLAAIEAFIMKAGGSEQVSRLESLFGVKKAQISRHFTIYEDRKKLYATPMPAENLSIPATYVGGTSNGFVEVRRLEHLLQKLTISRASVGETMAFCLEHAAQYAGQLARGLIRAVEEPGLRTDAALARLFVVSDVLYNSHSGGRGVIRYRASFQELLPDACERLGRQWFQRLERGRSEQSRAEASVRKVFAAWQEWDVFPPLFVRGLNALLFAPVADGVGADDEDEAVRQRANGNKTVACWNGDEDAALRRKLSVWRSAEDAARLPYAARLRGLSGSALPTAACRARLCHYERYWHRPGCEDDEPSAASVEDHWGERLRRASLGEAAEKSWMTSKVSFAKARADVFIDEGEDGLDGLPLSEDEAPMDVDDEDDWEMAAEDPYLLDGAEGSPSPSTTAPPLATSRATLVAKGPTLGEGLGAQWHQRSRSGVSWTSTPASCAASSGSPLDSLEYL
eukprot:TRINITY_DN24830_c0_g1_i1.p1 TRINITY_DN24830_c0_g1~~TRINITY_DN24830_c0_g1_i1.p1  ORF type:complete len:839 (-),score=181.53 TRINITY_DN24830_c0_g1_i1:272-2713(-)